MTEVIILDDTIVSNRFCKAISRANSDGWKTFQKEIYENVDIFLKEFVFQLIVSTVNLRQHRAVSEESFALVIASMLPVKKIDKKIVDSIIDRFLFDKEERPKVLIEGHMLCQNKIPIFYQAYKNYLGMVTGEENCIYDELLAISWLVILVISKSENIIS